MSGMESVKNASRLRDTREEAVFRSGYNARYAPYAGIEKTASLRPKAGEPPKTKTQVGLFSIVP